MLYGLVSQRNGESEFSALGNGFSLFYLLSSDIQTSLCVNSDFVSNGSGFNVLDLVDSNSWESKRNSVSEVNWAQERSGVDKFGSRVLLRVLVPIQFGGCWSLSWNS